MEVTNNVHPSFISRFGRHDGISAELVGGLGNQLFIYATGYELSQRLNCPLYLDTTWFRGNSERSLALHQSTIEGTFIRSSPFVRTLTSRLRQRLPLPKSLARRTFVESGYSFNKAIANVQAGTKIRGYFQSWKYFTKSAEIIRSQICTVSKTSDWFDAKFQAHSDQENWLAIHVRRGDYLNSGTREFHGVLDENYYREALRLHDLKYGPMPIKVFTDDLSAARELFEGSLNRIEFIDPPFESSPLENLILMSQGSGIITANSSFSWWAAWLGDKPARQVIVPSPWFRGAEISSDDLFLENWAVVRTSLS